MESISDTEILLNDLKQVLEHGKKLDCLEDQVRRLYSQFELAPSYKKYEETKPAFDTCDEEEHRFDTYDEEEHRFETRDEQDRRGWFLIQKIRKLADEAGKVLCTYPPYCRDCTRELNALRTSVEGIILRVRKYRLDLLRRHMDAVKPRGWAAEKHDPVALFGEFWQLVDLLIKTEQSRPKLEVVAIVGEGGTGKSTLALKFYEHVVVRLHFGCRGWISVSRKYRLKDLLLKILNDVTVVAEEVYEFDEWKLKRQLFDELNGRRYLIVIDNVWTAQAWEDLRGVFPANNLGSRVIVTSRLDDMAQESRHRLTLGSLEQEDAWKLFRWRIFGESPKNYPPELETHAKEIAEKCGGRPIVIVVVACILRACEMTVSKWSSIARRFQEIGKEPKEVLTVCCREIPTHLKICFSYLGVFPEDFEISVKQLIQLWIAEGLVQHSGGDTDNKSLEKVAEEYLEELIYRNLIQVSKRRSDDGPKSCRIHDLLRDVCIDLSPSWHEKKFLSVYPSNEDDSFLKIPRRLSILGDCPEYLWNSDTISDTSNSSHVLHSLSCFSQDNQSISQENWESIFKCFQLLRVLNFGEGEVGKLPKAIEELFHLRYLKVKPAEYISFPKSVFNLWNLQTIDLRTTQIFELPKEIWNMQQLRHLYLYGGSRLPNTERTDVCLPNLQTLSYIEIDPDDDISISQKAPNLRKLGLYNYQCLSMSEENVTFDLPRLHSLKFAEICIFEESIKLPDKITKITLKNVHLQQKVIKIFNKVTSLYILKLVQTSFDDNELDFEDNSFSQLRLLKLKDSKITTLKGTIPSLHRLVISNCPLLEEVQWEMNTLRELELNWASTTLANKLDKDLKEKEGLNLKIYPPPSYTRGA